MTRHRAHFTLRPISNLLHPSTYSAWSRPLPATPTVRTASSAQPKGSGVGPQCRCKSAGVPINALAESSPFLLWTESANAAGTAAVWKKGEHRMFTVWQWINDISEPDPFSRWLQTMKSPQWTNTQNGNSWDITFRFIGNRQTVPRTFSEQKWSKILQLGRHWE